MESYICEEEVGDTKEICLISTWTIDRFGIDLRYHSRTSLRIGPQKLRFHGDALKFAKTFHLQQKAGNH